LLVLGSAVAQAQPARVPPAYAYKPQLTDDDRDVLARGEITNDQQIGGGVVALMFGFGTGQAVEGRWRDTGWMFTLGDTVAGAALMAGIISTIGGGPGCHTCARDTPPVLIAGAVSLTLLRIWETTDALVAPVIHNRRLRALRSANVAPYVSLPQNAGVAGLGWTF
jgi:hypothetical protein